MKSERRHELQHNALLDWLMQTGEKAKPYMNVILLGLVVVVVGFVGYRWMSATSANKEAAAWDSVFQAMNTNDTSQLDQTIEDHGNTAAAQWAAVIAGDIRLAAGCQELFTTKATAIDQFDKAREEYKGVLKDCQDSVVRERATYGLARTCEAMAGTRQSQQALDDAIEQYEEIVTKWPEGAYAKAAQARLNALSQPSTKEFYDALAVWEPRPAITSPAGMNGLNLPFGDSGEGLNVGEMPQSFFNDPSPMTDGATDAPGEVEPAQGAGEPSTEADPVEVPAMPAAASDQPAEEAEKPAE